eukprot:3465505-Rhodomonas_salina.1
MRRAAKALTQGSRQWRVDCWEAAVGVVVARPDSMQSAALRSRLGRWMSSPTDSVSSPVAEHFGSPQEQPSGSLHAEQVGKHEAVAVVLRGGTGCAAATVHSLMRQTAARLKVGGCLVAADCSVQTTMHTSGFDAAEAQRYLEAVVVERAPRSAAEQSAAGDSLCEAAVPSAAAIEAALSAAADSLYEAAGLSAAASATVASAAGDSLHEAAGLSAAETEAALSAAGDSL